MKLALEGSARMLLGETEAGSALLQKVDWRCFMRQEQIVFGGLLAKFRLTGLPNRELKSESPVADPEQTPAWRKAIDRLQKDQTGDVLPPLPALRSDAIESP